MAATVSRLTPPEASSSTRPGQPVAQSPRRGAARRATCCRAARCRARPATPVRVARACRLRLRRSSRAAVCAGGHRRGRTRWARRTASAGVRSRRRCRPRSQGQVVVLDQDGVEQAGAVVVAAAAAHRILFQPSPAGRRLARVVDPGRRAGNGVDIATRERGDARQPADAGSAGCARPSAGCGPGRQAWPTSGRQPPRRRRQRCGTSCSVDVHFRDGQFGGSQSAGHAGAGARRCRPAPATRWAPGPGWSSRTSGPDLRARPAARSAGSRPRPSSQSI